VAAFLAAERAEELRRELGEGAFLQEEFYCDSDDDA
jgi:hypothetical protein